MDLVRESKFKNSFIFKYSERGGTKAAEHYPDDIPEDVKKRRNKELLEVQDAISLEDHKGWLGKRVQVLVERTSRHGLRDTGPVKQLTGHTLTDHICVFDGNERLVGEIVNLDILDTSHFTLYGRVVTGEKVGGDGAEAPLRVTRKVRRELL